MTLYWACQPNPRTDVAQTILASAAHQHATFSRPELVERVQRRVAAQEQWARRNKAAVKSRFPLQRTASNFGILTLVDAR